MDQIKRWAFEQTLYQYNKQFYTDRSIPILSGWTEEEFDRAYLRKHGYARSLSNRPGAPQDENKDGGENGSD